MRTHHPQRWVRQDICGVGLPESSSGARRVGLLKTAAVRGLFPGTHQSDLAQVRYAATISARVRWLVLAAATFEAIYRPLDGHTAVFNVGLAVGLGALNGALHYRLISNRPVARRHVLGIGAVDIVVITAAIIANGGFSSFIYVAYFPVVGIFALLGPPTLAVAFGGDCRRHLHRCVPDRGSRAGPRCQGREGHALENRRAVRRLRKHRHDQSIRARHTTGRSGTGTGTAARARRAFADYPRHDRADRLHDRAGHRCSHQAGR